MPQCGAPETEIQMGNRGEMEKWRKWKETSSRRDTCYAMGYVLNAFPPLESFASAKKKKTKKRGERGKRIPHRCEANPSGFWPKVHVGFEL